jgi:NADH-quinone oxidoreductase subunit A
MVQNILGLMGFVAGGVAFVLITLIAGKLIRPSLPNQLKGEIYECGEPTVGSGWVQFDLRFYVAALLFVIFDVETALLYPWARVFLESSMAALWDLLFFLGLLVVGYAFLWKHGYLDWVRSRASHQTLPSQQEKAIDVRAQDAPEGEIIVSTQI